MSLLMLQVQVHSLKRFQKRLWGDNRLRVFWGFCSSSLHNFFLDYYFFSFSPLLLCFHGLATTQGLIAKWALSNSLVTRWSLAYYASFRYLARNNTVPLSWYVFEMQRFRASSFELWERNFLTASWRKFEETFWLNYLILLSASFTFIELNNRSHRS